MFAQDRLPEGYVSRMEPQIGSAARLLAPNEFLFRTGEAKTCFYRVNSGAVCLYEQNCPEHPVVDFAFPGDYAGLGFMQTHACCARAVTKTDVTCLPLEELANAIADDPRAQAKLDDAIEREFEYRRAALVEAGRGAPPERLAAFLVSLSRTNAHEGRDPTVIGEFCPSVFAYLGLRIEDVPALFLELVDHGLVEANSGEVRLKNIDALENLAGTIAAECTRHCRVANLTHVSGVRHA
jgi:CRP/FNR family transcriptional regulator, anaerobic regulatory protein